MDWILGSLKLLGLIINTAKQAQVPPELALAIIEIESGGNPYAASVNPTYPYTMTQAKRPDNCNVNTEIYMQKTAWGLMQIMGATARSLGFDGWLPELTVPEVNLLLGIKHLQTLMGRYHKKYGLAGVMAAYNGGSPRLRADGKFVNQVYVNKVTKAMEKYKAVVEEKGEEAVAAGQIIDVSGSVTGEEAEATSEQPETKSEHAGPPLPENDERPARRKKGAAAEFSENS
jgi:soluble lytic murein transglycosylase-like protein